MTGRCCNSVDNFTMLTGHWSPVTSHRSSVPSVVADLDLAILHPHRKLRHWLVGRGRQRLPGPDGKARAVARADLLVALDGPAGELPAVVRAHVLDRVVLAAEIEHDDLRALHVHDAMAAG